MPWKPYKLNAKDCWARVDDAGAPVVNERGLVDVIYKVAASSKLYRGKLGNLLERPGDVVALDEDPATAAPPLAPAGKRAAASSKSGSAPHVPGLAADAIHIWTDGGARPNPGPCGIGVVVVDGKQLVELSEFLGEGTNQIAELTAMLRGLEEVAQQFADAGVTKAQQRAVAVYSDSAYSIGLLDKNWKAKANVELVAELRELKKQFREVHFVKVAAHTGISLNERTDQLATDSLTHRSKRRQLAGSILDKLIADGAPLPQPS